MDEFLSTGLSGNRFLRWDVMKIAPNTSFSLHAHPNIELIYVISGTIFEIRRTGVPVKRDFSISEIHGPDLSTDEARFILRSTTSDNILINEKGSIHLTFTQENETQLLVLWGGKHANIPKAFYPAYDILGSVPVEVKPL